MDGVRRGFGGGAVLEGVERFVERLGADRAVVANVHQRIEEGLDVDDAGGSGKFALVVQLLIDGNAGGSIIEVAGDDVLIGEGLDVISCLAGGEPVPTVENESKI